LTSKGGSGQIHRMKIKVIIVILAVACAALVIGLLAVKKQGSEQHVADVSSIVDYSNQVVDANQKISDLSQVNLMLTNDLALSQQQSVQLSNNLAAAAAAIADDKAALAGDQNQITNLTSRISDLEVQNQTLDQRAAELTNTVAELNTQIADTQSKLKFSETNNAYLQEELQKQMAEKAALEHKFNDLNELRHQVKVIKTDLFIARRLQLAQNDNSQKKGAELLRERSVPVTNTPAAPPNYSLNVEVGSDGSVRVIPPLGAATHAPAQ
jgi:chromosome segregation ATPase